MRTCCNQCSVHQCNDACLQGKLKKYMPGMPLAKWIFVHPACTAQAHEWFKEHVHEAGLSPPEGRTRIKLSIPQINSLQQYLGHDDEGVAYLQVKYQHHGEMMYVPAGLVHQVENLQMCVKLAWDFFGCSSRLPVCLAVWQQVHARIDSISAKDYLYAAAVLHRAVDKLVPTACKVRS